MTRRIPLFPLNVVLFPGMTLPLHIFEPRYQQMIRTCLETDRLFGVCLIRSGQEVGGPADPHLVGTTCEILSAVPLGEGRLNLATVGRERFRVLRTFQDQPYLEAEVELLPEHLDAGLEPLTGKVRRATVAYIRALLSAGGEEAPEVQLPDDPVVLSYLVGAVLQVPLQVRQELLEQGYTAHRLRRQLALLESETAKLEQTAPARRRMARRFRVDPERISLN